MLAVLWAPAEIVYLSGFTSSDAYYDQWKLTNRKGVKKNINWNSAAALEYLGPPANNQRYRKQIENLYNHASSVIYSNKNPFSHYIHIRCDDPVDRCFTKCKPADGSPTTQKGTLIAYAMQKDPDDSYSMINVCPRFMQMRRLRDNAIKFGKSRPKPDRFHLKEYDNTARVMLHEIFHLNFFMNTEGENADKHVNDLSISYETTQNGVTTFYVTQNAYDPLNVKILAR